jgi:hypothetical protein
MRANEFIKETASVSATSSGNFATVANPVQAHAKLKRDKNGIPTAPQKKKPDGTAVNALDVKYNVMGSIVKR